MMNRSCPRCGFSNAPDMNFCTNCGQNLFSANQDAPPSNSGAQSPQIPHLQSPPKRKSKAGLFLILAGVGLLIVLFVGGIGLLAIVGALMDENKNKAVNNSSLVLKNSSLPNKNSTFNSNSSSRNSNLRSDPNANSKNYNSRSNSSSYNDATVYGSLTEGKDLEDVRQQTLGKFRLVRTESSDDWETAVERENLIYKHADGTEVEVGVARFNSDEEARQTLRKTMKIFEDAGDDASKITECVNRADEKPIGLMATVTQESINTHRLYWTDGAFLFVVSVGAKKEETAEEWMSHSSY